MHFKRRYNKLRVVYRLRFKKLHSLRNANNYNYISHFSNKKIALYEKIWFISAVNFRFRSQNDDFCKLRHTHNFNVTLDINTVPTHISQHPISQTHSHFATGFCHFESLRNVENPLTFRNGFLPNPKFAKNAINFFADEDIFLDITLFFNEKWRDFRLDFCLFSSFLRNYLHIRYLLQNYIFFFFDTFDIIFNMHLICFRPGVSISNPFHGRIWSYFSLLWEHSR